MNRKLQIANKTADNMKSKNDEGKDKNGGLLNKINTILSNGAKASSEDINNDQNLLKPIKIKHGNKKMKDMYEEGEANCKHEDMSQTYTSCDPKNHTSNVHFYYDEKLNCGKKS